MRANCLLSVPIPFSLPGTPQALKGAQLTVALAPARPLHSEPLVRTSAVATPASRSLPLPHLSDLECGSNCFPFSGYCVMATEEKHRPQMPWVKRATQVPGAPRKGDNDSGSQRSEEPLGPVPGSEHKGFHLRFCHVTLATGARFWCQPAAGKSALLTLRDGGCGQHHRGTGRSRASAAITQLQVHSPHRRA